MAEAPETRGAIAIGMAEMDFQITPSFWAIAAEGVKTAGFDPGGLRTQIESVTTLGRIGKVEEIALLVSDDAPHIAAKPST